MNATFTGRRFTTPLWVVSGLASVCIAVACGADVQSEAVAQPARSGATSAAAGLTATSVAAAEHQFTFESGPVRPLALSADGTRLFVANTAAATLDILAVNAQGVSLQNSVPVGLEPVAVAVRSATEVWVVNHLSDSVSVVDVASSPPRVTRTLLVGDEPRDIVFAGANRDRAFITTAHRGQQRSSSALAGVPGAGDPQLTTPGVGRADVWVFDASQPGTTLGGRPAAILTLFGDTPRALATTPDGRTVYAAVFHSGNRSTVISSLLPCDGFDSDTPCTKGGNQIPGSIFGPATNDAGVAAPRVGLIVKEAANGSWLDAKGRDWSGVVRFNLPDDDVFAIDATTLATTASYPHIGTTLFNMAINPKSGAVYVSNTESRNDLRFEGPGTFAGTTLQGHLAESQITVINAGAVAPRHLNKHINYSQLPAPAGVKQSSLATPVDLVVSADGATLYVAAFGSSKVGVLPTAALENDSFDPTQLSSGYIAVSGGGPGGLVLDEARRRLYVSTRFDSGVSVVDVGTRKEIAHIKLSDPDAQAIKSGRRFLYDANVSSSNGEASCSSCHMFGDADRLAWDLGDPDADQVVTPVNIKISEAGQFQRLTGGAPINGTGQIASLHPMKGPMTTQTLRGMVNHGAMHWRGDRVSGFFGTDPAAIPPFNADLSFKNFIVAFNGLLGLDTPFSTNDMQSFSNFALAMIPPPNPVRRLDNSLTASQARGRSYFLGCAGLDSVSKRPVQCGADGFPIGAGHFSDGLPTANGSFTGFTCQGCHVLNPAQGFFGTDGESSFEGLPQTNKIPHLRNLYDKIGMFGIAPVDVGGAGDTSSLGKQVSGFGFLNDGSVDTVFHFLQANGFSARFAGLVGFTGGDTQRRDVEAFMHAFDSDLAPIVGQQITLDASNAAVVGPRIDLLIARAATPFTSKMLGGQVTECDLVARGVIGGKPTTFVLQAGGSFVSDSGGAPLTDASLRNLAKQVGQQLTYTCLPPGWAPRLSAAGTGP